MNRTSLPYRTLTAIAGLLLLLPNILFLFGWIHAWIAGMVSLMLLASGFLVWRNLPRIYVKWQRKDYCCLFVLFLGCLFATESLGFFGQTQQLADFSVRNAFYETLVRDSWPLFNDRAEYIVYYLAYWLPPAALAKIVSHVEPNAILHCWTLLHFCTVFGLLYVRFRHKTLLLMGIIFMVAPVFEWVEIPFLLRELAERFPATQSIYDCSMPLWDWNIGFRYDNLWRQLALCSFNNGLPAGLLFALLMAARPQPAAALHYSALIVSSSPLSAVAFLPYLGMRLAAQVRSKADAKKLLLSHAAVPAALLLLVCVAAYFSSSVQASPPRFLWQYSNSYSGREQDLLYRLGRYAIIVSLTMLPAWFFLSKRFIHTAAFRSSMFLLMLLPLVWIGNDNNELLLKGSVTVFLFLAVLYMLAYCHCPQRWMRRALLAFFAASSIFFVIDLTLRFSHFYTWNPALMKQNINNEWGGHLNHHDRLFYSQFFGRPAYPCLLKTHVSANVPHGTNDYPSK